MAFDKCGSDAEGRRRFSRTRVSTAVVAGFAFLLILTSLVQPARASNIDVTIETQVVNGVRATFGFNLQYAPQDALARPGTEVTLGFAPGPLPATLVVDVLGLLGSGGVSIPSYVTDFVNSTAALLGISDPWVATIPIANTPIGPYKVYSVPLYQGLPVYLDINIVGLLKGDLSASAGSLDRTRLTWTGWGGQDVKLTLPSGAADVTVSAAFRYSVSNDYLITIEVPGFEQSYSVASFPLGEVSFGQPVTSHVEVIEEASGPSADWISPASLGLGIGIGAAAGAAAGLVIGKRREK